jgi:hypothetical protein
MGATEERPKRFLITDGSAGNFPSQKPLKAGSRGLFDLHYAKQATATAFSTARGLWLGFLLLAEAEAAKSLRQPKSALKRRKIMFRDCH